MCLLLHSYYRGTWLSHWSYPPSRCLALCTSSGLQWSRWHLDDAYEDPSRGSSRYMKVHSGMFTTDAIHRLRYGLY